MRAKVITFFSEKGGMGKTTLTALFASWLRYKKGERVVALDMDYPMYHLYSMREKDLSNLRENPNCQLSRECVNNLGGYYPIGKGAEKGAFNPDELNSLVQFIRKRTEAAGGGYYLIDFPGRYLGSDPVWHLSRCGLIDLVVFPIDSDRQSIGSALYTYESMQKVYCGEGDGQRAVFLWNKETGRERNGRRDWYGSDEETFRMLNIPVIHRRMRDILIARRDSDTFGFVRNTLCWPEQNIRKACRYLPQIFEEIKLRADGAWTDDMISKIYEEEN